MNCSVNQAFNNEQAVAEIVFNLSVILKKLSAVDGSNRRN